MAKTPTRKHKIRKTNEASAAEASAASSAEASDAEDTDAVAPTRKTALSYIPTTKQDYNEVPNEFSLIWLNGLLWKKLMNEPTQERGEQQDNIINSGFQPKPFNFRAWHGIIKYILETYGGSEQEKPVRFLCCDKCLLQVMEQEPM